MPAFPASNSAGLGVTWNNCQPGAQPPVQITLSMPVATQRCGEFTAVLDVIDPANGNILLTGTVTLDYTRTWGETVNPDPAPEYQVWRFAAKVDLASNAAFAAAPPCLNQWPTAFYYGYVDYALRCGQAQFESAIVLYHACDKFVHNPALSATPGAFHPNASYGLVSPSTAANPFFVQNLPPIGGRRWTRACARSRPPACPAGPKRPSRTAPSCHSPRAARAPSPPPADSSRRTYSPVRGPVPMPWASWVPGRP